MLYLPHLDLSSKGALCASVGSEAERWCQSADEALPASGSWALCRPSSCLHQCHEGVSDLLLKELARPLLRISSRSLRIANFERYDAAFHAFSFPRDSLVTI